MVEFVDCTSLSISYDATGKVTASITVLKDSSNVIDFDSYTDPTWGNVDFNFIMTSASQKPILGGPWYEWAVQLEGVGE